jgi:hypothetical protein
MVSPFAGAEEDCAEAGTAAIHAAQSPAQRICFTYFISVDYLMVRAAKISRISGIGQDFSFKIWNYA